MKQLFLLLTIPLVILSSCKKDEDDGTATSASVSNGNKVVAVQPPVGFTFPKIFRESKRISDFKIWAHGVDVTNKMSADKIFEIDEWPSLEITLLDKNRLQAKEIPSGDVEVINYFYTKEGLFIIDEADTFPIPIALGNYNQIELYDYQIKLVSEGFSSSNDVFEKSTKASLEQEAKRLGMTKIDTMAYLNRSLIMK